MAKKANAPPSASAPDPDTDYNNMYGTKFLGADDVKKPTRTTITAVDREVFDRPDGRSEAKATLSLAAFPKALICNKTNAASLASSYGRDFAKWVGKPVMVRSEMTSFQGKPMRGLRVYPVDVDDMKGDTVGF